MPDSDERRQLAARQRDHGLLSPGDPEYDKKMIELWGGPPPQWYDKVVAGLASEYGYPQSANGKFVLVTGGFGGIGFYLVKALARLGFNVIVPARPGMEDDAHAAADAANKVAALGGKVTVPTVTLDLRSLDSVRSFGEAMRKTLPCLDVLCLNAGRGGGKDDAREETKDGIEAIMQVNALSHFLLACELMPLLRKSSAGRVASQSSGARYQAKKDKVDDLNGTVAATFSAWDQYCLSKAANVLFTLALNDHLAAAGIDNVIATASDPGLTSTGVNIQHDLVKSIGVGDKLEDTNKLHDVMGHHAADGSMALMMASAVTGARRNDFYTAGKADEIGKAVYKLDPNSQPNKANDPLCESSWAPSARQSFWEQAVKMTNADWDTCLAPASNM